MNLVFMFLFYFCCQFNPFKFDRGNFVNDFILCPLKKICDICVIYKMLLCLYVCIEQQSDSPGLSTPAPPAALHSLQYADYATHGNPLCPFNPTQSDVFRDSSPPGPLSSCCLLCHYD